MRFALKGKVVILWLNVAFGEIQNSFVHLLYCYKKVIQGDEIGF